MKRYFFAAALLILVFMAGEASAGGFDSSCREIVLQGTVLKAECRTRDGRWVPASIDLNAHVRYYIHGWYKTGVLDWGTGGFAQYCSNIRLEGVVLKADCGYPPKNPCELYLSHGLNNDDGQLNPNR